MPETTGGERPQVLMVDDEKEVADAYALRLDGVADVTTVYSGREALSAVEEGPVPDVVLLDRHMPDRSGDEVLADLRAHEAPMRVIMVTAIDPDLDILDLPFDDYLCKPVDREDVREVVEHQCRILAYDLLGSLFRTESKRAVIEAELPPEELADNDEFQTLQQRRTELRSRICRLLPGAEDLLETFEAVGREAY